MHAGSRSTLVWIGLLWAIECMDILTTSIGRAQGFIETMPISAAVMNAGGMGLFVLIKLLLVAAGAVTVLLALRWMRGAGLGPAWFTHSRSQRSG